MTKMIWSLLVGLVAVAPVARAAEGAPIQSARTVLIEETVRASKLIDGGAKGLWTTDVTQVLNAAEGLVYPNQTRTNLLESALAISKLEDKGPIFFLLVDNITTLLAQVQGIVDGEEAQNPSARTQLVAQTLKVSKLIDQGVVGLWTVQITVTLDAANQYAGQNQTRSDFLEQVLEASKRMDENARGFWSTNVTQMLARVDEIIAQHP